MTKRALPGFRICDNKGFHVTFENGYTVSVQFGPGNYCLNHHQPFDFDQTGNMQKGWESPDAETACWGPGGAMLKLRLAPDGVTWSRFVPNGPDDYEDTVQGWQSPAAVLALLNWAASQPEEAPCSEPS